MSWGGMVLRCRSERLDRRFQNALFSAEGFGKYPLTTGIAAQITISTLHPAMELRGHAANQQAPCREEDHFAWMPSRSDSLALGTL